MSKVNWFAVNVGVPVAPIALTALFKFIKEDPELAGGWFAWLHGVLWAPDLPIVVVVLAGTTFVRGLALRALPGEALDAWFEGALWCLGAAGVGSMVILVLVHVDQTLEYALRPGARNFLSFLQYGLAVLTLLLSMVLTRFEYRASSTLELGRASRRKGRYRT